MSAHEQHGLVHLVTAIVLGGGGALLLARAWVLTAAGADATPAAVSRARVDRTVIALAFVALAVLAAVLLVHYAGGFEGGATTAGGPHSGH